MLELVLTDVPDVVEIRFGLPVVTSDHNSFVYVDVVLGQPIPHFVCRQVVYLKNSVDWKLVRGDVTCLNWNGILRFPCPASALNEALFRVLGIDFP